jgi:hypothetical protein
MRNLLKETVDVLHEIGKSGADVAWIGNRHGTMSIRWDEFEKAAMLCNYDGGYGGQEVASDLIVMGAGGAWWLERGEYDGSEWWNFMTAPKLKPAAAPFSMFTFTNETEENRYRYEREGALFAMNKPEGDQ